MSWKDVIDILGVGCGVQLPQQKSHASSVIQLACIDSEVVFVAFEPSGKRYVIVRRVGERGNLSVQCSFH